MNGNFTLAEKKGNAPYTRDGNECEYHTADGGVFAAENVSNNIIAEKPYASPVKRADNDKDKRNSIEQNYQLLFGRKPFLYITQ